MFKIIMLKEIREIIQTRKYIFSFLICSLLIILSFYTGARWYENGRQRYETALAENLRQMSGITDWIQISHHIFLPAHPLAALVTGIDNDIGRSMEMQAVGELRTFDSMFSDDPIFAIFRFLDLEFIFTIVLALFAILFGYNMINGEKESGTLRLVFANAISRDRFILGKMTGALLAIVIPLLIPILTGCLILLILNIPMNQDDWIRLAFVIFAGLLYFSIFLLLSIFLSAVTRKSTHSFLLALVIWILSTLIIPRAAVLLAGRAIDVPTVDESDSQKFRFRSQLWAEDMKKMNEFKAPQSGNPQEMMDAFHKYMGQLASERNKKIDVLTQKLNEQRRNRQNLRENVSLNLARISPSANFSLAVAHLSGTSLELQQRFLDAAQSYQHSFAQFLGLKTDGMLPGGGMIFRTIEIGEEEPEPINPKEIPAFMYREPGTALVLKGAAIDFSILILFNLVLYAGSFVAFLRYDLR